MPIQQILVVITENKVYPLVTKCSKIYVMAVPNTWKMLVFPRYVILPNQVLSFSNFIDNRKIKV